MTGRRVFLHLPVRPLEEIQALSRDALFSVSFSTAEILFAFLQFFVHLDFDWRDLYAQHAYQPLRFPVHLPPEPGKNTKAAAHEEKKDDPQMMFNISIDGSSLSENLDEFDSIRSVLLYRLVNPETTLSTNLNAASIYLSIHLFTHVANSACCQELDCF